MARALYLLPALTFLAACSEPSPEPERTNQVLKPMSNVLRPSASPSWGSAVLDLVPGRSGNELTTDKQVADRFASCNLAFSGTVLRSGVCAASPFLPHRPAGVDKLVIQVSSKSGNVAALRLVACCTEDDLRPFQGQSVIRAEKLCPEITLVASQPAHVFRISAPGKRDFVYAEINHGAGAKAVVSHTIMFAPSDVGSECTDVVTAEKLLDAQFGTPSLERPE